MDTSFTIQPSVEPQTLFFDTHSPAWEALAGLSSGSIRAHQRFIGIGFIFALPNETTEFEHFSLTPFSATGSQDASLSVTATVLGAPPDSLVVQPLTEFYFLSVISDRPGYG